MEVFTNKGTYGPAECSVTSAVHGGVNSESEATVIGRAVGCVCWIVDQEDHDRLLPIGAVGELLIEGPIVGRGYLNDPVQTAAAFIEPPTWLQRFRGSDVTESCLYKTGDLAQYTTDGSLRFIGRKDTQVKIRGQRIELGDIEHHTRQCFPGAQDIVAEVVTPTEAGRPPVLVAFVWAGEEQDPNASDILLPATDDFRATITIVKAHLLHVVPSHMVPAVFLPLIEIPLTATGKTNRRRLRERAAALSHTDVASYSGSAVAKRPPATVAERMLQRLWARVLDLSPDAIGADDSFFHLGGDSITAMQMVCAARRDGISLAIPDVIQSSDLATLACRLERRLALR